MQVFLLHSVQKFLVSKSVYEIRNHYGEFEMVMHGNVSEHCQMTAHGFCRGMPEFFDESLFANLNEDLQSAVCHIPLSHPIFCGTILVMWTITILGQFRKLNQQFNSIILRTNTDKGNIYGSITSTGAKDDPEHPCDACDLDPSTFYIGRLSICIKVTLFFCVFVPRLLMHGCLLWIGCRWLLATTAFDELVLNAVALAFILELGELIYASLAPVTSKKILAKTRALQPYTKRCIAPGLLILTGYVLIVVGWVAVFMLYLQDVLPGYAWDVHNVCEAWMAERYQYSALSSLTRQGLGPASIS